jgi:PTS system N-acetylglucosamine-specific IIA component
MPIAGRLRGQSNGPILRGSAGATTRPTEESVMALQVLSPMPGRVTDLAEVPDPMFAQAMLGPGVAIDPPREPVTAVAPISGTIISLFPHAVGIESGGYSVLVHLGLETVNLNGKGFTLLKAQGDQVAAGDPVIEWNPAVTEAEDGLPVVTPLIAVQAAAGSITQLVPSGTVVEAGTPVFEIA